MAKLWCFSGAQWSPCRTPGGSAIINNFVQGSDQLQMQGYNIATVLADSSYAGGTGMIVLPDGTTIELKNLSHALTNSDFKP